MRARTLAAFLLALLAAGPARGHDLWIEPSTFNPAPGETVKVALRVGVPGGESEPVARNPRRLVRLAWLDAAGERPILGADGAHPAGFARAGAAGSVTLVYEGNAAFLELPAERFEHYLAEEGLERISELRQARGESARPGRESYSRSVKALLAVGETAAPADRALGLPFELVLSGAAAAGKPFEARLFFRGEPLSRALIGAWPLAGPRPPLAARTDAAGRVTFTPPLGGAWVLAATHMIAAPPGTGADWESFWTSLSFVIAAP